MRQRTEDGGRKTGTAQRALPWLCVLLAGCASAPKADERADPTLVQQTKSALQAFELGSYERAARFYELALERAWTIDDAGEVANNAFNLAATYILLGRLDAAEGTLSVARGEYRRLGRNPADILLLEARIARVRGDAGGSAKRLDEALSVARSDDARLQAWILKADVACDGGDLAAAGNSLETVRRLADRTADEALKAGAERVGGRVALLEKDPARAAASFDREARHLQEARRFGEMAAALDRAGRAYREAGAPGDAADRFYRAARSLYAQRDYARALQAIDPAMAAAVEAGDEALKGEVAALFGKIKAQVGSAQ